MGWFGIIRRLDHLLSLPAALVSSISRWRGANTWLGGGSVGTYFFSPFCSTQLGVASRALTDPFHLLHDLSEIVMLSIWRRDLVRLLARGVGLLSAIAVRHSPVTSNITSFVFVLTSATPNVTTDCHTLPSLRGGSETVPGRKPGAPDPYGMARPCSKAKCSVLRCWRTC